MRFFSNLSVLNVVSLVAFVVFAAFGVSTGALARPEDYGLGLQDAASPVMHDVTSFHNLLLVIIIAITIFVMLLLLWVMIRYNKRANPEPSNFSHNTLVEVLWTALPIAILVLIAIPSFRLLYFEDTIPEDIDMTVKATAHQWYWTYSYPDHDEIEFDSYMLKEDELTDPSLRLLDVDNPIVVPVGAKVRILVTSTDVIHNFAMPQFGLKVDAIPGRINEKWFQAEREGSFFGQCSELCGKDHAFMPIRINVVSEEEFASWLTMAKEEWAGIAPAPVTVAANRAE